MSRNEKELWTFENGERFTIAGKHYTYVGRYNTDLYKKYMNQ